MGQYTIKKGKTYISFAFDGEKEVTGQVEKTERKRLNGEGKANLQNYNIAVNYKRHRKYYVKKIAKIENKPTQFMTLLFSKKYALNEKLKIFDKFKRWLRTKNESSYFIIKVEINKNDELHLHIITNCNDVEKIETKWRKLNRNKELELFKSMDKFSEYYIAKKDKRNRDLKLLDILNGKRLFTTINEKNITYQPIEQRTITLAQKEEIAGILAAHARKQGSLSPGYADMLNANYGLAINLPPDVMEKINFVLSGQEEHF